MSSSRLDEIRERVASHELVYERPDQGAPCWAEYRRTGSCSCQAEADVDYLLDLVEQLTGQPCPGGPGSLAAGSAPRA